MEGAAEAAEAAKAAEAAEPERRSSLRCTAAAPRRSGTPNPAPSCALCLPGPLHCCAFSVQRAPSAPLACPALRAAFCALRAGCRCRVLQLRVPVLRPACLTDAFPKARAPDTELEFSLSRPLYTPRGAALC